MGDERTPGAAPAGGADPAREVTDDAAVAAERRGIPWLAAVLGIVLVAVLAFSVGRFSTFGDLADATGTDAGPNAADIGFARDMQVHHGQAVEMAMIEYRATDDEELRTLAYDIATAQSGQRGQMYAWIADWGVSQSGRLMSWMSGTGHDHGGSGEELTTTEAEEQMGMASDDDLARLQDLDGADRDRLFVDLMIRHHQGAIEMVDAVEELGSEPEVLATARQMAENQTAEIDLMESIRDRLG